MASVFKPTRLDPETGRRVKYRRWYVKYKDHLGVWRKVPGYRDKAATQKLARDLERHSEQVRAGLIQPEPARTLEESLADYERYLKAKGNTARHVQTTIARIEALMPTRLRGAAVQSHLASLRADGLSVQTTNYYLQAARSFTRWLVRERRLPADPLSHLRPQNPRSDVRHARRVLAPAEVARLLEAAAAGPTLRGLPGPRRVLLYRLALTTGLRARELASLTASSFDLEADPPTVTVEAAYSKHRRVDVLPLRRDVAAALRAAAADPLFPGTWSSRPIAVLRPDLKSARIPYRTPAGVFDFHALRHQFISDLARSGVHPKVAQTLARHGTITLTMDRYSHASLAELGLAVEKLSPEKA